MRAETAKQELGGAEVREEGPARAAFEVSLGALLWAALLIAAACLRFIGLPGEHSTLEERQTSWSAFRIAEGIEDSRFHGTIAEGFAALQFAVADPSPGDLRYLPAAAGFLAVFAFWPLGRLIGGAQTLLAAAIFAMGAVPLLFARHLTPEAFAPAVALLLVAAWFRDDLRPAVRWPLLGAAGFLVPLAGGAAVPAAAAVAIFAIARRPLALSRESPLLPLGAGLAAGLLLGAFRLGAGADGFTVPSLSAAGSEIGREGAFGLAVLVASHTAFVLLAAAGLGVLLWRLFVGPANPWVIDTGGRRRMRTSERLFGVANPGGPVLSQMEGCAAVWAALALLWLFLTPGNLVPLLSLSVPASILAARFLLAAANWVRASAWWPSVVAYLVAIGPLTYALFAVAEWSRAGSSPGAQSEAAVALALAGVALLLALPALVYRKPGLLALNLPFLLVVGAFLVRDGLEVLDGGGDDFLRAVTVSAEAEELRRDALRAELEPGQHLTVAPELFELVFRPGDPTDRIVLADFPLPSSGAILLTAGDAAPPEFRPVGGSFGVTSRAVLPFDGFLDHFRWMYSRELTEETPLRGQLWVR